MENAKKVHTNTEKRKKREWEKHEAEEEDQNLVYIQFIYLF